MRKIIFASLFFAGAALALPTGAVMIEKAPPQPASKAIAAAPASATRFILVAKTDKAKDGAKAKVKAKAKAKTNKKAKVKKTEARSAKPKARIETISA